MSTCSCPMLGRSGVWLHAIIWCIRNGCGREKIFCIDGRKLGVKIATKRLWGSPRTPPCALLENLHADFHRKSIAALLYHL